MKRDDYRAGIDESMLAEAFSVSPDYKYEMPPASTFTPVTYNYDAADEENDCNANPNPDSAVIIVQHNPENDKSHIKHITIQILGNNGVSKTYTLTVDVYQ